MKYCILTIVIFFNGLITYAQKPATDTTTKHNFTLFKPVPKAKMREMQTDRPDVTESAYTVDAGHFQYESDAFKTVRNKQNNLVEIENFYNQANIKAGITNSTDLQIVVPFYVKNKTRNAINDDVLAQSSGFGDLTVRLKQNIWGNDKGKTAFAIMPFFNVPTAKYSHNKKIDGGIIFPFAAQLQKDWNFGAQAELDFKLDENKTNYNTEILNSVTLGKELTKKLSVFIETVYTYNFRNEDFQSNFNGGGVYSISDNFNLDAGFNAGLTKNSDNVYFVGFSFRY